MAKKAISALIGGSSSKLPSAQDIEAKARAERDKQALEKAGTEASQQKQLAAAQGKTDSRVMAATILDEETGRKRFLKGI